MLFKRCLSCNQIIGSLIPIESWDINGINLQKDLSKCPRCDKEAFLKPVEPDFSRGIAEERKENTETEVSGASSSTRIEQSECTMTIDEYNELVWKLGPDEMAKRVVTFTGNDVAPGGRVEIQRRTEMDISMNLLDNDISESRREAITNERDRMMRLAEQLRSYRQIIPKIIENSKKPRLILDVDKESRQVRVEVNEKLETELQLHQRDGIKFMYNCIIENVDRIKEPGSGCILAHGLGAGKSFQVLALIHTILTNKQISGHIRRILITTPPYTLQTWTNEMDRWIVDKGLQKFNIDVIYDKAAVNRILLEWREKGGIIIIGHNLFSEGVILSPANQDLYHFKILNELFSDPGPDLIFVDEAHLTKSPKHLVYQAVDKMPTKRKILITGIPLQTKLEDYYYMMELIKPHLLGSLSEFMRRYGDLDINHKDHYLRDKRLMMKRLDELKCLVSGSIQRFNRLRRYIPPKYEYVVSIRPSEKIFSMYNYYLEYLCTKDLNLYSNPYRVSDLIPLLRCVNHPFLLQTKKGNKESTYFGWHKQFVGPRDWMENKLSGKFIVLFKILESCVRIGEKLIVVSQSTETLDLIARVVEHKLRWKLNDDYFRMTDKTEILKKKFDSLFTVHVSAKLLLLYLRNFGVDLSTANRVILFDVSWSPIDEDEVISRVYRLRQSKPVYVYRFVTSGTIEETILRKQMKKRSMINLIVDEKPEVPTPSSGRDEFRSISYERPPYLWHLDLKDRLLADSLSYNDSVLNCVQVDLP